MKNKIPMFTNVLCIPWLSARTLRTPRRFNQKKDVRPDPKVDLQNRPHLQFLNAFGERLLHTQEEPQTPVVNSHFPEPHQQENFGNFWCTFNPTDQSDTPSGASVVATSHLWQVAKRQSRRGRRKRFVSDSADPRGIRSLVPCMLARYCFSMVTYGLSFGALEFWRGNNLRRWYGGLKFATFSRRQTIRCWAWTIMRGITNEGRFWFDSRSPR